jgi:hypothetical protein
VKETTAEVKKRRRNRMDLLRSLGIDPAKASISWDITPADTFGMFESWGGKERIRSRDERFYYFYIENGQKPAALCLMERGIKHARVMARIEAPQAMIDECVASQGRTITLDSSYAINSNIRLWLENHVIDGFVPGMVVSLVDEQEECLADPPGPGLGLSSPSLTAVRLRNNPQKFGDTDVGPMVRKGNFYDSQYNPEGYFHNLFIDNNDGLTVTDQRSQLMWMRYGCDINSIRTITNWIAGLNRDNFAGYGNWRLPTVEEGLTLLERNRNDRGLFTHPCFSAAQPFIFTADLREPGGHWFIDFTHSRVYWGSGFNPGGFGRACRDSV